MTAPRWTCAFLSTDRVDTGFVDDHHAIEPLARRGVAIETHPWRAKEVDWARFDLVIVRSTWDYHDHVDAFFTALERIEASGARLANPRQVMHWNARKTYLADLQRSGVPIVETAFGASLDDQRIDELSARFGAAPWIIKPEVSANAHGVFRLSGAPDVALRKALLDTFADRGFLAQPFIEDVVTLGEYSVFYFDGQFSHCILKTPKAGDFRVQEDYGSDIRAATPTDELRRTAEHVRSQLPGGCLYERIDLVRDHRGAYAVMEVELIEPSLYLRKDTDSGERFAAAVVRWLEQG